LNISNLYIFYIDERIRRFFNFSDKTRRQIQNHFLNTIASGNSCGWYRSYCDWKDTRHRRL